jgi:uncharacterized protein (TIGR02466 family)
MEMHSLKLFPTLVHQFKEVLSPEQLSIIRQDCMEAEVGVHDAFVGASKSSFARESRLIDALETRHPALAGLKKGLDTLIGDYAAALGFDDVHITNSWFNVQYPGSVLKQHAHPDSKVSAAFCIHADELSSPLFLDNPNPALSYVHPDRHTDNFYESMKIRMAPGDLVLFPSWIKHGSGFEANQSQARVMISLNAS